MAQAIADHPTVRAQLAERSSPKAGDDVRGGRADGGRDARGDARAHDRLREAIAEPPGRDANAAGRLTDVVTAVAADRLRSLDRSSSPSPSASRSIKLVRQLERRWTRSRRAASTGATRRRSRSARCSSRASPCADGAGHRARNVLAPPLVLHDAVTGERYAPIQHLTDAEASIELHNSPLSEYGALGFDYGYSVAAPETLVLWEAQFGDFVNGAQIIIDQFLVSGLSKWNQTSRRRCCSRTATRGNGPEHSSARLERFLQSAAQENIRVANPSTAAQYFHLLRRQALDGRRGRS